MNQSDREKNNLLVRHFLLFPEQKPKVKDNDKLALAIPHNAVNSFKKNLRISQWNADDQRDEDGVIGFTNKGLIDNKLFIEDLIWTKGVTGSKNNFINSDYSYSKIVIFLVIKVKHSNKFMFVIRDNKKILNNVLALGVMKSLCFDEILNIYSQNHKHYYSSRDILNNKNVFIHLHNINLTGEYGLFNEITDNYQDDIEMLGFIGGGKDLGIVYLLELNQGFVESIVVDLGGVVFELSSYNYSDVLTHYNLGIDGWSEAILKFFKS